MTAPQYRGSAGHRGLFGSLLALIAGLADFFESRFGLFATESKAALARVLTLIICLVGALMFLAIGYVFLIVGLIMWIARLVGMPWWWITLAAAVLHFLLALVFLLIAKGRTAKSLFPATTAELQKDRQWLKSLDGRSRPTN